MSISSETENKNTPTTITEAVILAGGYGLRLREAVPSLPKAMAPVAGRPFLYYLINLLRMQGINRFLFSLGYKAEAIERYLKEEFPTLDYATVVEDEPLGTGGGVRLALQKARETNVLVVNGDTLFKIDLAKLSEEHFRNHAECTVALKPMPDKGRYGSILLNANGQIKLTSSPLTTTLVNGGIYILNREKFFRRSFPLKFSFERDYLERCQDEGVVYGQIQDSYFIDIGMPADYQKAQLDLAPASLNLKAVDKSWTLFIDRDGVVNDETVGEYILHWDQFVFSKGVLQSFKTLSDVFGRLVLVTNQRGVGKGLMSQSDLDDIHAEMQREVAIAGGHLDQIYFCTDVDNRSPNRKPNPGMALQAKKDFPAIDFAKSIMVGNKPSDMRFGRAAGMHTVFLSTTNPEQPYPHPDIDLRFSSLSEFATLFPFLPDNSK